MRCLQLVTCWTVMKTSSNHLKLFLLLWYCFCWALVLLITQFASNSLQQNGRRNLKVYSLCNEVVVCMCTRQMCVHVYVCRWNVVLYLESSLWFVGCGCVVSVVCGLLILFAWGLRCVGVRASVGVLVLACCKIS